MWSCTNQPLTQPVFSQAWVFELLDASASVHYFLALTRALSMQRHRLRHYLFTALSLSFHLSTNDGTPINNAYQSIVIPKAMGYFKMSEEQWASLKTPSLNLINSVINWLWFELKMVVVGISEKVIFTAKINSTADKCVWWKMMTERWE